METTRENVLSEIRDFCTKEVRPFAADFDENQRFSESLIQKLASNGYLSASMPKEYGGLGLDPVTYGLFIEEIGKACGSTRNLITVHNSLVGESLLKWGTEKQKNDWLPRMASGETIAAFALSEPNVGSDAQKVETKYEKKGDKYILNGCKKWISFGDRADLFIVVANDHVGNTSAFLVERKMPGVTTSPIRDLLASRGSHIGEIEIDNVEIPLDNLLGTEGGGFTFIVNTALDHGRYTVAWASVALAQAAVEAMVTYSRKRKQFGRSIWKNQLVQGIIADAVTQTHAARALCLRSGEMRKNGHPDAVIETNIAKYFASKAAAKVTSDGVQIHGANGFTNEYPVGRLYREAKVMEVIEGTSQIQQIIISDYGLRNYNKKYN